MDDIQLLTIALTAVPTMLAVLVGILINHSRLNDPNSRVAELRAHVDRASMMSIAIWAKCATSGGRNCIASKKC